MAGAGAFDKPRGAVRRSFGTAPGAPIVKGTDDGVRQGQYKPYAKKYRAIDEACQLQEQQRVSGRESFSRPSTFWGARVCSGHGSGEPPAHLDGARDVATVLLDRRGRLLHPLQVGELSAERRVLQANPDVAAARDRDGD